MTVGTSFAPNHLTIVYPKSRANKPVTYHFAAYMAYQMPFCLHGLSPVREDKDADHGRHVDRVLPELPLRLILRGHTNRLFCLFLFSKRKGHKKPDDICKPYGTDGPGKTYLPTKYFGREDDGQHIDCGARIEKCRRRSNSCAHTVDAGKEGQHSTGTDSNTVPDTDATE